MAGTVIPVIALGHTFPLRRTILDAVGTGRLRLGAIVACVVIPIIPLARTFAGRCAIDDIVRACRFRFRIIMAGVVIPIISLAEAFNLGQTILNAVGTRRFRLRLLIAHIVIPVISLVNAFRFRCAILNVFGTGRLGSFNIMFDSPDIPNIPPFIRKIIQAGFSSQNKRLSYRRTRRLQVNIKSLALIIFNSRLNKPGILT
jgi:hypothetical protein